MINFILALASSALATPSCQEAYGILGIDEDCAEADSSAPICVHARTIVAVCEEREAMADVEPIEEPAPVASVWTQPAVAKSAPKPVTSITISVEPPPPPAPTPPVHFNPCGDIADSKSADAGAFDWVQIRAGSTEVIFHNDQTDPGLYVQPAIRAQMAAAYDNAYVVLVNGEAVPVCWNGTVQSIEVVGDGPPVKYPTSDGRRRVVHPNGDKDRFQVYPIIGRQDAHFVLPDAKASVTVLKYTQVYGKKVYRFVGEKTWKVNIDGDGHLEKWLPSESF